jgi:hypothetical protein
MPGCFLLLLFLRQCTFINQRESRDAAFVYSLFIKLTACDMCIAEPIPMRMRALPQSMWQEPNVPHNVSPATVYPVLPPLVTREGDDIASQYCVSH